VYDSRRLPIGGRPGVLSESDSQKIDRHLKGNTLKVYWYLLRTPRGSAGIREIQRALHFSSPTLAQYHLEKLRELGLAKKESTEYVAIGEANVGVLKPFLRFGTVFVPRFVLYAVVFTVLFFFFLTQLGEVSFYSIYGLVVTLIAAGILWYESAKAMRERPTG
jgi:hypothetical protein